MGFDKALLSLGEQTMLQRALRTAAAAADAVCIVGPKEKYAAFGDVVADIYQGCGPLGGIHAALSATRTDLNLILSVDMPLMSAEFLRWLLRRAGEAPELITVPDAAGGPQPLCAVYRPAVLEAVNQALQTGDYKIGRLFSQVPTCIVSEREMAENGFPATIFQNVNTPQDYDQISRQPLEKADRR
jgi:molybdopterin-guanine dinucleotide biosynthesis protein A